MFACNSQGRWQQHTAGMRAAATVSMLDAQADYKAATVGTRSFNTAGSWRVQQPSSLPRVLRLGGRTVGKEHNDVGRRSAWQKRTWSLIPNPMRGALSVKSTMTLGAGARVAATVSVAYITPYSQSVNP